MLPEEIPTAEKLKASISSLPDAAAIQTRAAIGEREGKIDNKTQIEVIRDEERKIKEELEEAKEVAATDEKEKDVLLDTAKVITDDITHKDIDLVSDALDAVSDRKNMIIEKEEIKEVKSNYDNFIFPENSLNNKFLMTIYFFNSAQRGNCRVQRRCRATQGNRQKIRC